MLQLSKTCISTSPTAWIFKEDELPSLNWQFPKSQQLELRIEETDLDFSWYVLCHVYLVQIAVKTVAAHVCLAFFPRYICHVCMGRVLENRWE